MTPKNIDKVYRIFRANYVLVPLEVFGKHPYQTLVSTIMSSRTNDDTTFAAAKRLFAEAPNCKALSTLSEVRISKLIFPVGFYKTKANHLKKLAKVLLADFAGKVPDTHEKLMTLPGVGRKTANLVLNRAFGKPAIAVDTHVHRITNMLGWVHTKTPEQTEQELVKIVPQKYWPEMNKLFVSIGRQYPRGKAKAFLHKNGLL